MKVTSLRYLDAKFHHPSLVWGHHPLIGAKPYLPASRTLIIIGDRAFGAVAPRVWNDLPADIVSAPSLAIFKRRLKTYLFGQSFG